MNLPEAVRLFRLSAAQGDLEGEFGLAMLYITGKGVRKDLSEGVRLLRMAADKGHKGAQTRLEFTERRLAEREAAKMSRSPI